MKKTVFLSLIALQAFLSIALQFTAWPEMIYEPYLMNNGFTIYKHITIAHAPLLLFMLQPIFKIISNPIVALKIFTLGLTLITGGIIYIVTKKLWKKESTALLSWLIYIFLQVYFEGNGIWFDHLVSLFSLLSFYFFYQFLFDNRKLSHVINIFLSGLFLGLAGISKQTAGWLVIPAFLGLYLFWIKNKSLTKTIKYGLVFSAACLLPWLTIISWLFYKEALAGFWFWAFKFGITILPRSPGQIKPPKLGQIISVSAPFLIILPFLFNQKINWQKRLFIVFWCLLALFGVYPRFERFHFQPALPLLAFIWAWMVVNKFALKYVLIVGSMFMLLWLRFFVNSLHKPVRFWDKNVQRAVNWLEKNTKKTQRLYVFNSLDHFYALADRLPAVNPVPPTLEWYLELPGLQEKLIDGLEKHDNSIIIRENYNKSGLGSYRPEKLDNFIRNNFEEKTAIGRFIILEKKRL